MISCNSFTEEKITQGNVRFAYPYSRVCKFTVRDKILSRQYYPTPGCRSHKVFNQKRIFERYCGLGKKANIMYWRSHKEQYEKLIEDISGQKQ